jgi:hypothetical protein
MKESDLYYADGSEDEPDPIEKSTGKSKPKARSLSERKTKVSGSHVGRVPPFIQSLGPQGSYFLVNVMIIIISCRVYTL